MLCTSVERERERENEKKGVVGWRLCLLLVRQQPFSLVSDTGRAIYGHNKSQWQLPIRGGGGGLALVRSSQRFRHGHEQGMREKK